jgi:tetratricopeptide (TPR) repeat protein
MPTIRNVAVFVMFITAAVASAEGLSAKEHYLNGKKAFELGQFDEAISEYAAAYRLKDDPALLYNLGQAHRLAGHASDALHFYKVYLNRLPDAANRDEVVTKIAELEKLVEQQKKSATLEQNRGTPPAAVGAGEPQKAPAPAEVSLVPATPPPAPTPSWSQRHPGGNITIAGFVVGGLGVAGLATGIAYGLAAKSAGDELTRLNQTGGIFKASLQSDGKADQLAATVAFAVGGAFVATGAALVAVGQLKARRAHAEAPSASILPMVGPTVAGASLHGSF